MMDTSVKTNKIQNLDQTMINALLTSINDLLFIMKVEGDNFLYHYANDQAIKHADLFNRNFIGNTIQDVMPNEIAKKLIESYQITKRSKQALWYNDQLIIEGKKLYFETVLSPILDDEEQCTFIVSVTRDVTLWTEETNEKLENELRYRSLFEHNLDSILMLDSNGYIKQTNLSTYHVLGYRDKELKGRHISSLIDRKDSDELDRVLSSTLLGVSTEIKNTVLVNKNGHYLKSHIKCIPIMFDDEIKGIYLIIRDTTSVNEKENYLFFLSQRDQLTGYYKRDMYTSLMNQTIHDSEILNSGVALLIVNIDRLKIFNESYGYEVGDFIIELVSKRIKSIVEKTTEKSCPLIRHSGDEFMIIYETKSKDNIKKLAERIIEGIKVPIKIPTYDEKLIISSTIGISSYPKDGNSSDILLRNAERALLACKENERGSYSFYDKAYSTITQKKLNLENLLRQSLEKDELEIVYQPQISLHDQKLIGLEALLRWKHDKLGYIPPSEFIPIAEQSHLIIDIGNWVFKQVAKQIKVWLDQGFNVKKVAVNLSAKQFYTGEIEQHISECLKIYDIPGELLSVEITESSMVNREQTASILQKLKNLKIKIAVDDFGTGYSSLSYLKDFPVDMLKIDRSFIQSVVQDNRNAAIVTTIISLAHSLGIDVIAEGVETIEQIEFLKKKHCLKAQGYYFSKPVTPREIEQIYY